MLRWPYGSIGTRDRLPGEPGVRDLVASAVVAMLEAVRWLASRCGQGDSGRQRKVLQHNICFRSQGATLRGYLVLPDTRDAANKPPPPVIIYSHGFSATQHMGLLDTARAMCARYGCAGLTFDHIGFGVSEGPRHQMCRWQQAVGYLDAVTYLRQAHSKHVDVDGICVWGESASSRAAMVAAATDPHIKAIIAITPPCGRDTSAWSRVGGTDLLADSDAQGGGAPSPKWSVTGNGVSQQSQIGDGHTSSESKTGSSAGARAVLASTATEPQQTAVAVGRSYGSGLVRRDVLQDANITGAGEEEKTTRQPASHREIYDLMMGQLQRMRGLTALVDDHRHGASGGAEVPPVVSELPMLVIPPEAIKQASVGSIGVRLPKLSPLSKPTSAFSQPLGNRSDGSHSLHFASFFEASSSTPDDFRPQAARASDVWMNKDRANEMSPIVDFLNAYSQHVCCAQSPPAPLPRSPSCSPSLPYHVIPSLLARMRALSHLRLFCACLSREACPSPPARGLSRSLPPKSVDSWCSVCPFLARWLPTARCPMGQPNLPHRARGARPVDGAGSRATYTRRRALRDCGRR